MLEQVAYHFVTVAPTLQEAHRATKHPRIVKLFAFEALLQERLCFFPFVHLAEARSYHFSNQRLGDTLGSQLLFDSSRTVSARFNPRPCPVPREGFIIKIIQRTELFQRPFDDGSGVTSLD